MCTIVTADLFRHLNKIVRALSSETYYVILLESLAQDLQEFRMDGARKDQIRDRTDGHKNEDNTLLPHAEINNKKTHNILKRCLYDPVHKRKVLHSLWIALIFISLGMAFGQNGPTLLDLQIVTNTNLETASFFLTGFSVGYLAGSALCGVIYDRVNKNFFLLSGVIGLGIFSILTPYCFNFVAMIFMRAVVGIFIGVIDAAGNAEQMRVWGHEGTELMQMIHFCFAIGGVISPLYSEPFLAKKPLQIFSNVTLDNNTDITTVVPQTQPESTDVQYAFIITGIICMISGIPWLIIYLQDKFGSRKDVIRPDGVVTQRKLPLPILLYLIFMISLMYLLYCCAEVGFSSFLMTFLVGEFNETKSRGAQITAVFWALFAVARFLMIFISQILTALQLLYISCFMMIITSIGFAISAMFASVDALVVFTALLGLSVSAVFPAGFSWAECNLVKVTSRVASCIMVSSSLGGMISPIITSYLMENVSRMWFCYLLIIEIVLMCLVFFILFATSNFVINKQYPFEHETPISGDSKVKTANEDI